VFTPSYGGYTRRRSIFCARSLYRLPYFFSGISVPLSAVRPAVSRAVHATRRWTLIVSLRADLDSHASRGPLDHLHRALDRRRVEVRQLGLRDLLHLGPRDLPDLLLVRLARALLDPGLAADEVCGRRALRHEGVRTVFEDGHDRGHDRAGERGRALVVLLDELAHVDAVRAQRGADGRRGGRLARLDLHLHDRLDLLRHLFHQLLDLQEVQLDRRLAAEDGHQDLDLVALGVHLVDDTVQVGERTVGDAHGLALRERDLVLRRVELDLPQDRAHL